MSLAGVKIQNQPIREGETCQIEVSGDGLVEVVVTIGGVLIGRFQVMPPTVLPVKIPMDTAGKTLRVAIPGDFASTFILAGK